MQIRQSGMPDEQYWESLMDVKGILDAFGLNSSIMNVVELGCGYGTFTIPIAGRIAGSIYTYDLDDSMVVRTNARAVASGARNVFADARDVAECGFSRPGLPPIDVCLLFNILHAENPVQILKYASEILEPGGRVAIIHWRHDDATPRGPSMDIRPAPQQIIKWAEETGELQCARNMITLPPWHYGLEFRKWA